MTNNNKMPPGIDYEYDTGHLINDWRQAAPAGTFLSSGGPNDSIGWSTWSTFKDDQMAASGGIHVIRQQELRNQHPALQEAWEAYLALLHVCNDK